MDSGRNRSGRARKERWAMDASDGERGEGADHHVMAGSVPVEAGVSGVSGACELLENLPLRKRVDLARATELHSGRANRWNSVCVICLEWSSPGLGERNKNRDRAAVFATLEEAGKVMIESNEE